MAQGCGQKQGLGGRINFNMTFLPYALSPWQWAAVIVSCVSFGISKTGISGISIVAVSLFALVFGGKESTGVVLPLYCFADLFAVVYYRRHAEWKYIWRLIPWTLAGFCMVLAADRLLYQFQPGG